MPGPRRPHGPAARHPVTWRRPAAATTTAATTTTTTAATRVTLPGMKSVNSDTTATARACKEVGLTRTAHCQPIRLGEEPCLRSTREGRRGSSPSRVSRHLLPQLCGTGGEEKRQFVLSLSARLPSSESRASTTRLSASMSLGELGQARCLRSCYRVQLSLQRCWLNSVTKKRKGQSEGHRFRKNAVSQTRA